MDKGDFKKTFTDHCVFIKKCGSDFIMLLLYVNDNVIGMIQKNYALKKALSKSSSMKDLESTKKFLGCK